MIDANANLVSNVTSLDDTLFIIENINEGLSVKSNSEKEGIVLEGICAVFGVPNNNRRLYEKEGYLPHLAYLKEKIEKRQLFGELDHPQRFEVELKSASHIVEDLWFDGNNKVMIRVRILESTPMGKIAKALVEAGCQLSISSRAAGRVVEGRVDLQRIFTYDLVGEPGFTEAILKKTVNESFKDSFEMITESFNTRKHSSFIETEGLVDIHESLGFGDNYQVYKINNKNESLSSLLEDNEKNTNGMQDFATKAEVEGYTTLIKNKLTEISEKVSANAEAIGNGNGNGLVLESEEYSELVDHINYLGETLEGVIGFANYLAEKLGQSIQYNEHVAGVVNNVVDESAAIKTRVEKSIGYSNYIAERLNHSINYSEHVREHLNKSIKYNRYLGEMLDKSVRYAEYIGERTEAGIKYTEFVAEKSNNLIGFANYLAENLHKGIKYTEHIAETFNNSKFGNKRAAALNESTDVVTELTETVDEVLAQIKNDSVDAVLENKFPFLKVLTPEDKAKFNELDNNIKGAIVATLNEAVWFNRADVVSIMEAVIAHDQREIPNYIRLIPEEYKEAYSKMNEAELNRLHSRAQLYTLNTAYQIKTFWDETDLSGVTERVHQEAEQRKIEAINEANQSTEGQHIDKDRMNEAMRGYSNDYLRQIANFGK